MLKVECYTDSQFQENPVAFNLRDSRYKVKEIIDRWYGDSWLSFVDLELATNGTEPA